MQSWHQDVVVWCRNVWRVGYEATGWNVMHALEEAAVMNLHGNNVTNEQVDGY